MKRLDGRVTFVLRGQFAVLGPEGRDLTPSSGKARAILALLATAPQMRRSRLWLQQMLWSNRAPSQASGSLRQALVDIRRALDSHAGLLRTNRATVQIDPERVRLEEQVAADTPGGSEFLEGMPPLDARFDPWLRDMRSRDRKPGPAVHAPAIPARLPVATRQRPVVQLQIAAPDRLEAQNLLLFMSHFIERSLTELYDFGVVHAGASDASRSTPASAMLLVDIRMLELGNGSVGLKASIEECATLRTFWSRMSSLASVDRFVEDISGCLAFSQGIVQALSEIVAREPLLRLPPDRHDSSVLAATAMRKMFSMRHSELASALTLLDHAIDRQPRGLYYAWRAQLAIIRLIERQNTDIGSLRARAADDIARALEAEPFNSNVLASAANTRIVFDHDLDASLVLAGQGIAANKANPLAWWSFANALLYSGKTTSAYDAAVTAQGLADQTWLKPWADFQRSLTAAVTGRLDEAITYGTASHALAPNFRPPLRYLIALHARTGALSKSTSAAQRLTALEPDFSVARLVADPDYPASWLHRSQLIDRSGLEKVAEAVPA